MAINVNRGPGGGIQTFERGNVINDARFVEAAGWVTDELKVALTTLAKAQATRLDGSVPGLVGRKFKEMFQHQDVFDYCIGHYDDKNLAGLQGLMEEVCNHYQNLHYFWWVHRDAFAGGMAMDSSPSRFPVGILFTVFKVKVFPKEPTTPNRYRITSVHCGVLMSQWTTNWDLKATAVTNLI